MSYLHINNLYKDQTILHFRECYALEKIHGTSGHIKWNPVGSNITFFSGGEKHVKFLTLFDESKLLEIFKNNFPDKTVTVYGEVYGGSQQGMSKTYGNQTRFSVFDVQVGHIWPEESEIRNSWLTVPKAEIVAQLLGLEFVDYIKISTDMAEIDRARDLPSTQAVRVGITEPRIREGVVLRPLEEWTRQDGSRVIAKHKRSEFMETKTPRVVTGEDLQILTEATEIAEEWVTTTRLQHVLDKLPSDITIKNMFDVIKAMQEDVCREAKDEIVVTDIVLKQISRKTAELFKLYIQCKN